VYQHPPTIAAVGHLLEHRDTSLDTELHLRVRQKSEAVANLLWYGDLALGGDAHTQFSLVGVLLVMVILR
jgi:hypothetical protein